VLPSRGSLRNLLQIQAFTIFTLFGDEPKKLYLTFRDEVRLVGRLARLMAG
jgi:hypothetical protein